MSVLKLLDDSYLPGLGPSPLSQEHSFHRIHGFSKAGSLGRAVYSSRFHHFDAPVETPSSLPQNGGLPAPSPSDRRAGDVFFDPPEMF